MGVPTSDVGYTSAMPRREDHEVHKDMWGHWGTNKNGDQGKVIDSVIDLMFTGQCIILIVE